MREEFCNWMKGFMNPPLPCTNLASLPPMPPLTPWRLRLIIALIAWNSRSRLPCQESFNRNSRHISLEGLVPR